MERPAASASNSLSAYLTVLNKISAKAMIVITSSVT
jgi:hypothetical protein